MTLIDPNVAASSGRDENTCHHAWFAFLPDPSAVSAVTRITPQTRAPRVGLSALTGKVTGLMRSLLQIFCVAAVLEPFAIAAPLLRVRPPKPQHTVLDLNLQPPQKPASTHL